MLMVPKNWKELQVTYMPTFAPDKTLTFTMKARRCDPRIIAFDFVHFVRYAHRMFTIIL